MRSHAKAASAQSNEAGRGESSLGVLGACFLAALLLTFLVVPAAQAANSFVSAGEITAGEITGTARIAVDEATGNVLLVDSAKNRVDVFDSSGPGANLLTSFGEADLSGPYGIAVDQSNGDVYVTDPGNEVIRRYGTDGAPIPTYTLDAGYTGPAAGTGAEEVGSFSSAIAVDPTNADLLIADRGNDRMARFSSAGAFVSSFDGSDSPDGAFTNLEDVTLSPAGKIFVSDGEAATGGSSRVLRFSNAGAYEATLRGPAASGDGYLAYDAKHTELIVGDARECFFCTVSFHVLDPATGDVLFDVSVPAEQITGLASDPDSGRLYAAVLRGEFFGSPKVQVFAPQTHPELVLDAPGPVTATSIHLSGIVNPDGAATEYHFEVSKDGGATWIKSSDDSAGEGTSPVAVEADITVEPNTEYVAKLVASNADGAQDETPTQTFVTSVASPETVTQPAGSLTETSAAINGTINPYGLLTTYYFEYGPTTAYGTKIPVGIEGTAGNGRVLKSFSRTIAGLTPGATYHYRLVATNSAGTSQGDDETFTTAGAGAIPTRAYEQVTPVDKKGAALISYYGLQARADGNAVAYLTKAGPESSPLWSHFSASRGTDDWGDHVQMDPPLNFLEYNSFLVHPSLGVSTDYTRAFVATQRALTPDSADAGTGTNLYIHDLRSGAYQFVASAPSELLTEITGTGSQNILQTFAPDMSWVIFGFRAPLLPGAPTNALYKWSETDGLEVASTLPNGEPSSAARGSTYTKAETAATDGSRLYFSAYGGSEEGIFVRDASGVTTPVSVSIIPSEPPGPQPAKLLAVTPSGRYAFFVNNAEGVKLTSDATGIVGDTSNAGGDLYRYDASDGSLLYLGAQAETVPGAGVISGAFGIGADGRTIYFNRLNGPFTVWRDGVIHTVGPHQQLETGDGGLTSLSGRYYVLHGPEGSLDIYDAEADELSCVSCLPDGTRKDGNLPNLGVGDSIFSNRYGRGVVDDGSVYFDSTSALVAADVNGRRDVYTYREGRASLVSPGNGPFDAWIGDVSVDGSDIFFTTAQKLVGRDNDLSLDVYDARVNGGLSAQGVPPAQCLGSNCKTPAAGDGHELPASGSEGVNGPGNVKPVKKKAGCGKGKHKVRSRGKTECIKNKSQKRKANTNKKGGNR